MTKRSGKKNQPAILKLEHFLPYKLSAVSNNISRIIAETYKNKFALSITEWRIMAVLGELPGSSADEVSLRTQVEKSLISRALQKLLKRELVARQVDATDRRRQNLTLTDAGKDIYNEIVPVSYEYESALVECFSDEEREQLNLLLNKLNAHAREVEKSRS
jgi:DNA-binding MarR family transcriptional regulator